MTKADYGIDAPNVVRNLALFSLASFVLTVLSFDLDKSIWIILYFAMITTSLFAVTCWMIYSSRVVKPRILSQLISEINLKGDEKILDVGCGRGMLLIEAAKKVPNGKVYAIDLWSPKDQSGNSLDETLANAKIEKIDDRIEIETADMRLIPHPDGVFDVVISSLAIHNVPKKAERERALSELLRVLKPGGILLILDIHYAKHYAHYLETLGSIENLSSQSFYGYCPTIRSIRGVKK